MVERMVQVPAALLHEILVVAEDALGTDIAGRVRALLSQPTPTAGAHFCTPGCADENCPVEPFTAAEISELCEVLRSRPGFDPSTIRDVQPRTVTE